MKQIAENLLIGMNPEQARAVKKTEGAIAHYGRCRIR